MIDILYDLGEGDDSHEIVGTGTSPGCVQGKTTTVGLVASSKLRSAFLSRRVHEFGEVNVAEVRLSSIGLDSLEAGEREDCGAGHYSGENEDDGERFLVGGGRQGGGQRERGAKGRGGKNKGKRESSTFQA